jgi:hypothetical protein
MASTVLLKASLDNYLELFLNPKRPVTTENINVHAGLIRHVGEVLDAVGVKEDGIDANPRLSQDGKVEAKAELAEKTIPQLAFLARVITQQEEVRHTEKQAMYRIPVPAAAGTDPSLQYQYGREIRDLRRDMDQQARDAQFLKDCEWSAADEDEDPDVARAHRDARLWAILQTPGGPQISPEVLRRGLEERGRRLHPETFITWQQASLLIDNLGGLRDAIVGWLRGLGANQQTVFGALAGPEPEPILGAQRLPQRAV